MPKLYRLVIALIAVISAAVNPTASSASQPDSTRQVDIRFAPADKSTTYADSIPLLRKAPKWAKRYVSSLIRGNVDRTHETALDMSFGFSPSYTREASFGLGAICTGLYRVDRSDSILPPSDFFLSSNASLNGFFVLSTYSEASL